MKNFAEFAQGDRYNLFLAATTAKRDKKERSSFLSLLICPALSGYPF
jgi:hypothetical protein